MASLIQDLPQTETWLMSFRNYLTTTQDTLTKVYLLDFVIDCQDLLKSPQNHQLHQQFYQTYFDENCLKPVHLSNKVLREQLCEILSKMDLDDECFVRDLPVCVRAVSRDYKVWKGGLELAYQDYIASKPAPLPLFTATTILISLF